MTGTSTCSAHVFHSRSDGFFVDWPSFWLREHREEDWLIDQILARGRGHVFYAKQKVGKSLLLLSLAGQLVTGSKPVVVVYLDYEMSEADLHERLADMGFGPDIDLSNLCYALLPTLSPLDTLEGASDLLGRLDEVEHVWPDHHIVLVIDTTSRAVQGDENNADTIRAFYRYTGIALKQRGITWARLDHAGKDADRGQRGSSAKGDDPDVVWRIQSRSDGLTLIRDVARMAWVPQRVELNRLADPLRFEVRANPWPPGTEELATILDGLGVPAKASVRASRDALRESGQKAQQETLAAAVRLRKQLGT